MNNRDGINQNGEYRIDEMFSEIYETETMNLEDGSELLQEGLTAEEKARILSIALKRLETGSSRTEEDQIQSKRTGSKKRRILIASLVAIFAFATTAFAAEIFQWDSRLSSYFGIGERKSQELAGSGMNVGVSAENGGVTIEAIQAVGDGHNLYILLDVTAPEGQRIYPNSCFDMILLRISEPGGFGGPNGMGYSCDMIEDDNPDDNKATFLFAMEASQKINDKMINISFKNLRHYIIGSGELVTDTEGEWVLEWKLDYKDISKTFEIGKKLLVKDETVDVDSISISPIALNVKISGSYIKELDSRPRDPGERDPIQITAVTMKDGTVLTQDDASSWGCSIRDKEYVLNMQMKKLLDVEQIESVTLNSTEYVLTER